MAGLNITPMTLEVWKVKIMRGLDNKFVILLNILIPLVLGGSFYIITSSDALFVHLITSYIGDIKTTVHFDTKWYLLISNYLADILWGYSLVFAIHLASDITATYKIFLLAFAFSSLMEAIQMHECVLGTFDFYDIVVEGVAEIIAVIILKKLRRHQK